MPKRKWDNAEPKKKVDGRTKAKTTRDPDPDINIRQVKGLPYGRSVRPRTFPTPDSMYDAMIEYFQDVHYSNQANKLRFCENCGTIEPMDDKCCDNQSIKYKLITKSANELRQPTLTGFMAFIGHSKDSLQVYENSPGYREAILWFKTQLEAVVEALLLNPTNRNAFGAKFVAINQYGWREKSEVEHIGTQPVSFIDDISSKGLVASSRTVLEDTIGEENKDK